MIPPSWRIRSDHVVLAVLGAALLATFAVALVHEVSPEWARVQKQVVAQVTERMGAAQAAKLPRGMRQIWIERLGRVDRCVTCHIGIDGAPDLLVLPNPARSHPNPALIAAHPIEKFGCTLCHGGVGPATSEEAAHGLEADCEEPLLGAALAKRYGLTAAELMEVRCNACHRAEETTNGMPFLSGAKALVKQKRCARCHTITGKGGTAGPDLTTEGEVPPERRHFPAGWERPRTALGWQVGHMIDPTSTTPASEMPIFGFSDRDATALALLVSSWRRMNLPIEWMPGKH